VWVLQNNGDVFVFLLEVVEVLIRKILVSDRRSCSLADRLNGQNVDISTVVVYGTDCAWRDSYLFSRLVHSLYTNVGTWTSYIVQEV
jgi:hypothetical protein